MTIERVLVYGATGAQAKPVARRLLEAGIAVRAVTRDPSRAEDLTSLGAEVVTADLTDPDSLRSASVGVDGVFMLIPFLDPQADYGRHAIDAAAHAGVRLLVWNPTGVILPQRIGNPGMDVRLDVFEHLQASGVPHVVLQPTGYMENFLGPWTAPEVARDDVFAYPVPPDVPLQLITHEDVAAFAVEAFRRPELADLVLEVSGPEQLDAKQLAERFSRALGRPITFRQMPPKEFGGHFDTMLGPGAGADVTAVYEQIQENPEMLTTHVDLDVALAHFPIRPTTFENWVRTNAAGFAA